MQHALTQIRSVQFEMSRREDIDDYKLGKYVFVEHTSHSLEAKPSSEEFLDVVLRKEVGQVNNNINSACSNCILLPN